MTTGPRTAAIGHLRVLLTEGTTGGLTDGQLLERFNKGSGAGAEAAFAALVGRHGRMVFHVCRAVLRDPNDAEDAFQATFLTLARRAETLWVRDSLTPWLRQVALRTASCARAAELRRRRHERGAAVPEAGVPPETWGEDAHRVLREEVDRLPERYRLPVVLCGLEGLTREDAARSLGWPLGTLQSRLARGRERLRERLTRRGLAPLVPVLGGRAAVGVPTGLAEQVTRATLRVATGEAAAGVVSAEALALTEGVMKAMFFSKLKLAGAALLAVALATTGVSVRARQNDGPDEVPPGTSRAGVEVRLNDPSVVARVNGVPITRDRLIERCLSRYGSQSLDSLINEEIIRGALERKGLKVTDAEVDAQILGQANAKKMSVEAYYDDMAGERKLSRERYREDIVRPYLMLAKLAVSEYGREFDRLRAETTVEIPNQPSRPGTPHAPSPPRGRTQGERLDDLERKLDDVLKALHR
jgi:RNA polymerase sigma factor (sigma-70 family)